MGTGGVFGLTSALVGECLPGSGSSTATGNALDQGPVVFHWPQSVITELENRAHEDGEWLQLLVDLHRYKTFSYITLKFCPHRSLEVSFFPWSIMDWYIASTHEFSYSELWATHCMHTRLDPFPTQTSLLEQRHDEKFLTWKIAIPGNVPRI